MTDRKFRNRVQKARKMREQIRKNRFIGMDQDGVIISDRTEEEQHLAQLNEHLDKSLREFNLLEAAVKQVKSIAEPEEYIDDLVCTKVAPTEQLPVPDGDGSYAGNWKVIKNTKKVEAQMKEITKMNNKKAKLEKKAESVEERLMLNALNGEYLPTSAPEWYEVKN